VEFPYSGYYGYYGNQVRLRPHIDSKMVSFIDVANPLPAGPISRIYFYANPTNFSAYVRLQIWRGQTDAFSFQLVWEHRQVLYVTRGGSMYQVKYMVLIHVPHHITLTINGCVT
jgi:hypothetical protein